MRILSKIASSVLLAIFLFVFAGLAKAVAVIPPTAVDLGLAEDFAILAGTPNITDAGNFSSIEGDVGLSPATAADIAPFCSQVTGTIFGVDAGYVGDGFDITCFAGNPPLSNKTLVDNAKLDLTTAYVDAAGRVPVTTIITELGGATLTAGVYGSVSTTFEITAGAGPLILDGEGDASSVFIFKMAMDGTGLIVGPGSEVQLTGEAQACNVFWQLNTATIDTTAVFKGTILALNSITVANGANIEGRLLARNGNVTLINDTITIPACSTPPVEDEEEEEDSEDDVVPGLPHTGFGPVDNNGAPWAVIASAGILFALFSFYLVREK